ncbi:MAG: formylmethanofuran dehydrogenase subunit C [Methanomicrobiales archaeon]|jgi:formylmethanofuran dehydrogenase subunit C|nr:formylmethanofuran dehydrogenase subunit C [Methanomicrobiales archaeon]
METVTLTIRNQPALLLEADNISPDAFSGKRAADIGKLHVYEGRSQHTLGEFFDVTGDAAATAADTRIVLKGDLTKVKYIGMKMSAGEVVVEGSLDMYAGAWMQGGKLLVKGNVNAFAGIGMRGGELTIEGNAGNYLGAAYRGDWRGMQGGRIVVKGDAGSDIGTFMNGGEIVVGGNTDVHVGTHAEGGRIVIKGNALSRVGGQMVEGEIYVYGTIDVMMPGFKYIKDEDLEVEGTKGTFALYYGDTGERHRKRKGEMVYGKLYRKVF